MLNKIIEKAIRKEEEREGDTINLIASENFVSDDIMRIQGSVLTNKYAEGYPGKRYYGGCEFVDMVENEAIVGATALFNCKYANVQPHSGASANLIVYLALLSPGDKILSMNLSHGGHLSHGHPVNASGILYNIIDYKVDPETELIDYDNLKQIAEAEKPKLIIAGASAYPRIIDFSKFREIADSCGAYLMADIAHISGLVASGVHPSPFPYSDIVTSTTHKTLRGPRGGIILTNSEEIIKKINKANFPGMQGGPLMHVIAAKAQCFTEAQRKEFIDYQKQTLKNIKAMEAVFKEAGYRLISGGTDNHLLLIDINHTLGITGLEAQNLLEEINIVINRNSIPYDTLSKMVTSGIRLGSPAMTTKGFKEKDFEETAHIIIEAFNRFVHNEDVMPLKKDVEMLLKRKR